MRAKLDENMPVDAKPLLAAAGWSVATVHDEGLVGAPEKHNGIVVLRPVEPDRESVLALLTAALPLLAAEPVRQRL